MRRRFYCIAVAWLAVALVIVGCVAPGRDNRPQDAPAARSASGTVTAPKRIKAAFMSNPPTLMNRVNQTVAGGRTSAGITDLGPIINSGLSVVQQTGTVLPRLATAVPSVEAGTWAVLPDGRAQTTWELRPDVRWHDGAPFTPEDVLFSARMARDSDLPLARPAGYEEIAAIETVGPRTVRVEWTRPYIEADVIFNEQELVPRHILEAAYLEDKSAIGHHAYWTTEFVGLGPFKVREFVRSSHLVLEANDQYVLGRPRVDEIEIKFLPDPNTLSANLLAGDVELTIGQNLNVEAAVQLGAQWREGHFEAAPAGGNPLHMFPQFINPNPPVIADLAFRRALTHALNRQEIVDSILAGRAEIAHGILWGSSDREWRDIDSAVVRYEYDPRRAMQMLDGLGYVRGADGFIQDAAGQRLSVELRTLSSFDSSVKVLFPIADYWQRVGVGVETLVVPEQRQADREYRAARPGFDVPRSPRDLSRHHTKDIPLPENNFRGTNRARYGHPDLDRMIDTYYATIPWPERMAALRGVVHHITDQVTVIGLFFDVTPAMIGDRLSNVRAGPGGTETWNAHEWATR
jgi:peptide/nickel transport system substrate-binding protein